MAAIVDLVNCAYRPAAGASGWTHEVALMAGARTSAALGGGIAATAGQRSAAGL